MATKFIFYTDYHLANRPPINRKDDFSVNQIRKLKEVYDIAKNKKADFVVFGGDFFNTHRIYNYDLISQSLQIIINSGLKTYAAQGQHDLIGHNKDSYKKSTLSFLESFSNGYFQTLWKPLTIGDFSIHPCHWFDKIEDCVANNRLIPNSYNILIAHQSITRKKNVFQTILTKDIKSDFNLILSGDIHSGHELHRIDNTDFYNPGSLTRMSIKDKKRIPKIALIEFGKEIEEIYLNEIEKEPFYESILEETLEVVSIGNDKFFEEISNLEQESANLKDLISKIAIRDGLSKETFHYISSILARVNGD